jgi:hypothetical protein
MTDKFPVAKTISISESGHDEHWLRDMIYENPEIIGLGPLLSVKKEKIQSSGGILDLLLEDPDDESRYEVELMLGVTDESHIIRTIEYWDNEKRIYPQRQHFAVIIAEEITNRFFNVIRLLSMSIPIVAIKASMLQVGEQNFLNFTTILDIYEEREDTSKENISDEKHWKGYADWTLETSKYLLSILLPIIPKARLNFVKNYISINDGSNIYYLDKRTTPKSRIQFVIKSKPVVEKIKEVFDKQNIYVNYRPKYDDFNLTLDKNLIEKNKEIFIEITKLFIEERDKKHTEEQ